MQYLWQYYLLIGIVLIQSSLFISLGQKGKIFCVFLCFLELSFLSGFRSWNIGNDTLAYVNTFILSINFPELMKSHMEIGFLYLNRFIGFFTNNPQAILITTSIFIIGVWMRTLYKYSTFLGLSLLLFTILEFSSSMCIVRQEFSLCIILLGLPFVIKRQLIPFLAFVAIAMTIHTSAISAIGLYFIYPLKFKMKYFFWVLIGTVVVFVFLAPILDQIIGLLGRYGGYKGRSLLGEETKIASLVKLLIKGSQLAFCIFTYKYILPKTQKVPSILPVPFLLWCLFASFSIQFISVRGTLIERIGLYFSPFTFISIPYFVRCYPAKMRIFVAAGLLLCFILYKSIVFVYRPEWNYVLPFEFCF